MKLHLPKGLRSAVLACMAVVGGFATTVGTGFVTGGTLVIAFAALHVQAETYEITGSGDGHLTSATAADKVILNLTGWLTPDRDANGNIIINAPVEVVKAEINDGSSDRTYTFKNTITGSGVFSYCPESGSGANNQTYVFEGDMSDFSGDMSVVADKKGTFTFKNNKTGTGSIVAENGESVVNIEGAEVNNRSISAATINISGTSTFKSGISLSASKAINNSGTITLTNATIGRSINNTGSLTLSGTINLTSSMGVDVYGTGNDFSTGVKYVVATGNAITVVDGTTWTLDGAALTATYSDNAVHVDKRGTVYGIMVTNSVVDSSTVTGESGYVISAGSATLKLTDYAGPLADGIIFDVGADNAATVELTTNGQTMAATEVTRRSGSLSMAVSNGATLQLTQNTSAPNINGDLSIGAGGTADATVQDAFGWGDSATKNVNLIGEAGKMATLKLAARVTQKTNINMQGYAQVLSTSAADSADPAAFDTFGGSITAIGTNNTIGVAIRERKALIIEVTNEGDALEISGRVYRSASGDDGSITKTGAGVLTFSYSNEDNANSFYGLFSVNEGKAAFNSNASFENGIAVGAAGELSLGKDTAITLNKAISVAAGGVLSNAGASINVSTLSGLEMLGGDSYVDIAGKTSENGYRSGDFIIVKAEAGSITDELTQVMVGGVAVTASKADETGSIIVSEVDKSTYWVNTELTYDAATMGDVSSFTVVPGGVLKTADSSILNKVTLQDATSGLYLVNAAGKNLLQFTGNQGGTSLEITAATDVGEDGYLSVSSGANSNVGYKGSIVVLSGTKLVAGSAHDSFGLNYLGDTNRTITVQGGAMVDIAGKESYYHYILEDGAVLANNGGGVGTSSRNMPVIDLLGDATVIASAQFGMLGSSYGATDLNLNGHTLTKVGEGIFHLRNTAVDGGTINIQQGRFDWLEGTVMPNTTLQLGGGAQLDHSGGSRNLGGLVIATTVGSGTGAAIDVYGGKGPLTVTGATLAEELLTKKGTGQLNLNGAVTFAAGAKVENGTLVLNNATTIGAAFTVTGGTLTVGNTGSVSISTLSNFAGTTTSFEIPTTNSIVTVGGTYKVLDKTGGIVNNFASINYGGQAYTIGDDGNISITGAKIYCAVEANSVVTVGGDSATEGTADATEFYVKKGATLAFADTLRNDFVPAKGISGDGTVRVSFTGDDASHDKGVMMDTFSGTVEIAGGNSNLATYRLGESAVVKLTAGEHWSSGGSSNLDILLSDKKDSFVFRNSYTFTMEGKVSGKYLDLGTTKTNGGTVVLANSANAIEHVSMGTATNTALLTLAADMAFTTVNAPKTESVLTLNDGIKMSLGSGTAADASAVTTLSLAGSVTINVKDKATLAVTTQQGSGTMTKQGAGTMSISGTSDAYSLVVSAGDLVLDGATMAAQSITGAGTVKLTADSTFSSPVTIGSNLALSGNKLTGDVTVNGTLTSGSGVVAGTLTLADTAQLTDAASATDIELGTYTNTKGLTATDNINVGTMLTSSAAINATKITGEGSVEITGGTVTLSDTTDAFENTGTTSIADATLAGTWTADGVTIGTGVTASGEITLANSTINSTITSTGSGSVVLSGDVTVGVTGVDGDSYYTHNETTAADGNGFRSGSTDYTLVNGTSDGTGVTNWLIDGTAATNTSYTDGVLTVQTNADPKTYWVNTGTVFYDGANATYGEPAQSQSLAATTSIKLNGGELQLTTGIEAAGYISASTNGGTLDVNGQSITQAVFGTLEGKVELTGAGTYDLGTGVTALATNVELAENVAPGIGWTGTVEMSNVTLNNGAYSPYAATNLEVTNATITGKLEMKGGTLTLGGTITADMTALADETTTTISWSDGTTGTEGTGFSRTSRAVQLVDVDVDDTVSVATGTTWNAMEGATATFNTADGVLTVLDKSWTKVFNIKAGATVDYTATDDDFINDDDVAATAIRMNGSGSTLNLNSELADTMTGGIEVNGTDNTISINGTKTALAKGSLSVQDSAAVKLTGNGIYDLSADTTDPTLGTGVSLATDSTGWTGTVKVSDATVSGWDIDTLANGANSTVEISGVTGSLAADAVDAVDVYAKVAMAGKLTIDAATTTNFKSAVTGIGALEIAADSALTFDGDTTGWNGAITRTGTGASSVTYTGTTTIANSISNTGTGKLALYIDGTNIGGTAGVTVTGDVDVTALTIDRATTIKGSLAVSDTLTNNADLTLTQDLTLVGQLDGTGSLTGTNLVLQGAANKVGDLTLTGALTMGTADVASKLTAGELDIAGGVRLESFDVSANVIEAASVASALTFNISDSVLDSMLAATKDKTLTLLKLTTGIDAVTAKQFMLGAFTATGTAATEQESERYRYTLAWNDDYTELTLKAAIAGYIWTGEAMEPDDGDPNTPQGLDYNWTAEGNWASGVVPNETSAVFFTGANKTNAIVAENVVAKAGSITIDAWDASRQSQFGISGDGTLAVTGDVVVNAGTLGLLLDTTIGGDVIINVGNGYSAPSGLLVGDFSGATASVDVAGGLSNAGSVMVNEGSELSVGAALTNKGILEVAGTVNVGTSSAPANMLNSGEVVVLGGALTVTGDMASTGADLRPEIPAIGINVLGGSLKVGGTLTNSDTVQVSGADTAVAAGSMVNTKGTLDVQGGQVTIGTEDVAGTMVNTDGTITIGTADTTGSMTVNGDVSNGGGTITVENGALVATGAVNNDGGTLTVKSGSAITGALTSKGGGIITIGTDDTTGSLVVKGDVDITGGSLTLAGEGSKADISGDLTVTKNNSLTVKTNTSLTVGGDMKADNVTLDFGGDVTVGGDVEIGTLTNNGVFTANGSKNTVHIDTLTNNGTLSVGKETDSVLTGGHLEIGTLSGKGAVNVGTGGSLTINSKTEFTGQLNNLGTLHITTTTLASAQTDAEQTAGDIVGESLSITDAALGYSGGAYKLGDVVTDKLTVDGLSPDATRLSMASLKASAVDADGKVTLVLSDVEDGTVTDGSYHLITGSEETPFMDGGIHEVLDLSRYGYNEEGVYDATMATVQSDYMQKLLQLNKYVTFSDVAPTASVALLSGGTSDLYMSISEQTEEMSVWHLDGAHDKTEAGLTVLKDGKLVSDNILDNVQKVVVTGDQTIDLSGERKAVTLNGLTADGSEGVVTLTVSGDGSAVDKATLNTAADGFDGTLNLTKVSASINGKVPTINADTDTIGELNVTDSDVNLLYRDTTLGGTMKGGSINFGLGSKELGVGVLKGDLAVVGTDINVEQTDDSIVIAGVGSGKTVIADLDATNGSAAVTLNGIGFNKYFANARLEGGAIVADRNAEYATQQIDPTTSNGEAGAQLIDDMFVDLNPQASMPGSAYAALMDMVDAGAITDETAAAIAGSSISALGMALSGDVERQLRAIRNRTTSMGVNECVVNEGMPYFNAWFNAEGNRGKLSADGTAPGYTLDSWGGTVGFDVDVNPNLSMGLAITAMYGDFTAEGPDALEGDMDTYYLSLFARYADCAWTHTFVATVGMMDGSVERTVPGMYGTDSSIDGTTFGLMYEVGYVIPLDEDGEACVQPIFNVMLRHASVGSMTEEGAPLGLEVGKQSMTTLTFGLGARLQAVVGESLYNRASIFEARVLAKADVGDRRSEADVGFPYGGPRATVQSAELGAIGLEVGAGLTIPLGDDDGSIFFDASLELRSGYTNVNGTVGYRINF